MNIALIILPIPFFSDQKRNAPLGIMYIAALLERARYQVSLVDLRDVDRGEWLKRIPKADIYGIGATSMEYHLAVELAQDIKQDREGTIVLGGVHPTVVDAGSLDKVFDVIVQGEGEQAMLELVSDYEKGTLKRYYRSEPVPNLDSLPFPARHLLPYDSIISTRLVERGQPATTIITSRGCPYGCTFCANKRIYGRRARFHSVDRVVDEIKLVMKEYALRQFRFQDDSMTINTLRLKELCRKLAQLDIKWRCHTHVNNADYRTLTLLKEGGCDEVGYGVETVSQKALDLCNKKTTVEKAVQAIENAKRAGLRVRVFLIIGLPGDFGDVTSRVIDFIKRTKPDGVNISTLSPLPGCELHDNPAKFGMKMRTCELAKYKMTLGLDNDEYKEDFVFDYDEMSNEELKYHRQEILKYVKGYHLDLNR